MKPTIKRLTAEDTALFQELLLVFEDVFEFLHFKMPPKEHLLQLLAKQDFMVYVALHNNQVAGGLTAYVLPHYYEPFGYIVYIRDLAVKVSAQRQGIGRLLIAKLWEDCKLSGVQELFVQAEGDDDDAQAFYRATGAEEQTIIYFHYPM